MSAIQTTVSTEPTTALPGQLLRAQMEPVVESGVCDEANGVAFGSFVCRDGSDDKWDLPASAAEVGAGLVGLVVRDGVSEYVSASVSVENGESLAVMLQGIAWVNVEGAVTKGGDVYVRHTSDGGSNTTLGTCRGDADTGRATKVPNCVFLDTTSGAGKARVLKAGQTGEITVAVTAKLADVSTASSAFVAAPISGKVVKIFSVLEAAITGADSNVTTEINGVAITGGGLTVAQSGSAAGDRDSATPTAANTVVAGDALEAITDGASTNTAGLAVTFVIKGYAP